MLSFEQMQEPQQWNHKHCCDSEESSTCISSGNKGLTNHFQNVVWNNFHCFWQVHGAMFGMHSFFVGIMLMNMMMMNMWKMTTKTSLGECQDIIDILLPKTKQSGTHTHTHMLLAADWCTKFKHGVDFVMRWLGLSWMHELQRQEKFVRQQSIVSCQRNKAECNWSSSVTFATSLFFCCSSKLLSLGVWRGASETLLACGKVPVRQFSQMLGANHFSGQLANGSLQFAAVETECLPERRNLPLCFWLSSTENNYYDVLVLLVPWSDWIQ